MSESRKASVRAVSRIEQIYFLHGLDDDARNGFITIIDEEFDRQEQQERESPPLPSGVTDHFPIRIAGGHIDS